jgi:sulfur-carrier protein
MRVTVKVPVALRQYTQNESELHLQADTVWELFQNMDTHFPGLKAFIIDDGGELRRYVNVFVNDEDARSGNGLMTKLKDGDQVSIVPVVAGGLSLAV